LFQIDGGGPSINAVIVHNTIVNASNARWCILIVNGATGAQVYNNIIINQHPWRGSIALDADAVPGFNSDYNILINSLSNEGDGTSMTFEEWQDLGYDANSMLADPLAEIFVSPAIGNYHLTTNSQAINEGNSAQAFGVDEDLDGVVRPQGSQHDLGAYEHQGSLAIDEEEEEPVIKTPDFGIIITSEKISWPTLYDGQLQILSAAGQVVQSTDIATSGEINIENLIPGVYLAVFNNQLGVQWVHGFFVK
jgi:hypothetical protein